MNKITKFNRGFFRSILSAFSDLDASITEQIDLRQKESQLLPLIYFTSLMLLLSQLINVISKVQEAPFLSVITAVVVSYLFFLPLFMYIVSFIFHYVLQIFGGASSSFQTRLALFWSLTLSAPIILSVNVLKVFMNGLIDVHHLQVLLFLHVEILIVLVVIFVLMQLKIVKQSIFTI